MTVTTFGIIGTGWRSEFFLRLARAAPDRLRATGVVSRSAQRGAEITARWGPPAFESVAALLRAGAPDFVIPCVPWAAMPDATREVVGLGARVLAETPPAPDLSGLRAVMSLRCIDRVQPSTPPWDTFVIMPRRLGTPIAAAHKHRPTSGTPPQWRATRWACQRSSVLGRRAAAREDASEAVG